MTVLPPLTGAASRSTWPKGRSKGRQHARAYKAAGLEPQNRLPKEEEARQITEWMYRNFYDIRTFGAVMTTEVNAGQVRGPVQLSFARSVELILPLEMSITRSSVTNERDIAKERTMGRKHIVPYGLYRAHGFINAKLAGSTCFSEEDLDLLWQALCNMFELDRSAARGMMATRRLTAFRHESPLGNAHAHQLFDRVKVLRCHDGQCLPVADLGAAGHRIPRRVRPFDIGFLCHLTASCLAPT